MALLSVTNQILLNGTDIDLATAMGQAARVRRHEYSDRGCGYGGG
ncbi:MAG: hypothetical protein WBA10_14040 [Elainellaceae cyanobacterium]